MHNLRRHLTEGGKDQARLIQAYRAAARRALLLDYDGTLVPFVEEWFGQLPVGLIAEHAVWLRLRAGEWRMLRALTADWKERARPVLQVYADRLPEALFEEKAFSRARCYLNNRMTVRRLLRALLEDTAGNPVGANHKG